MATLLQLVSLLYQILVPTEEKALCLLFSGQHFRLKNGIKIVLGTFGQQRIQKKPQNPPNLASLSLARLLDQLQSSTYKL